MTPEAGFLSDILEHPDDDAPRLVYADWLDDHDDPARAEFIRAQCALARLPEDDPARDHLEPRERALLAEHRAKWLESLPPFVRKEAEFRRGFVEKVTVRAAQFVKKAKDLFQAAPIRHASLTCPLRLRTASEPDPALAACSWLSRLASLKVGGFMGRIGDDGIRTLVASPHLAGLASLDLSDNYQGQAGMRAIAESPHLASLTALDVSHDLYARTSAGDEGAMALAGSPYLANLRELWLGRNNIGPAGSAAIAQSSHLRQLVRLDLDNNKIGPEGALAIARSANFAHLTILNVASNRIGMPAMEALLTSPGLPHLADIDLSAWIGAVDLDMLEGVFSGPTGARLTRLVLDDHRFGDAIFPRLAPLRLRCLRLETCGIGLEGVRMLAEMPLLECLRELDLGSNLLGDAGAKALVQSPRASNLRMLRLSANKIGPAGAQALVWSPYLAGLRELEFYGNDIGNAGARALASSPHLNHLRSLRLHNNRIFKSLKPELKQRFGDAVTL